MKRQWAPKFRWIKLTLPQDRNPFVLVLIDGDGYHVSQASRWIICDRSAN